MKVKKNDQLIDIKLIALPYIGLLVKALPCRLQNDSPPHSLDASNIDKNEYHSESLDGLMEVTEHCVYDNNNVIKVANMSNEMSYVNLNKIIEDECDVIPNEIQGAQEALMANNIYLNIDKTAYYASESETNNTINSNNNHKMNNFYMQATPTIACNNNSDNCAVKSIVSTPNQKTITNFNSSTVVNSGDNNINSHMNANNKNTFANCNIAVHGNGKHCCQIEPIMLQVFSFFLSFSLNFFCFCFRAMSLLCVILHTAFELIIQNLNELKQN